MLTYLYKSKQWKMGDMKNPFLKGLNRLMLRELE